jgi:hypothetical protein
MRLATFAVAACLTLASTPAFAQEVTYDFDRSTDFGQIKTYAWIDGTSLDDDFNHRRIIVAVDSQLSAKGLRQAGIGERPDVYVAYHALFRSEVRVTGTGGWGVARRVGTARTEEIVQGTLVIDLISAEREELVWRGIATQEVDLLAKPEQREKNIRKSTEKLFRNYPPRS